MKSKKEKISIVIAVVLLVYVVFTFYNIAHEEPNLIDSLNSMMTPDSNIETLLVTEKYEPDLYFCMGRTVSGEIYSGYIQLKTGYSKNGQESLYLPIKSLYSTDYHIMKKTPEEGAFVFGFVEDVNVNQVLVNDEIIEVKHYSTTDNISFGFWYMKVNYDFCVKEITKIK